LRYGGTVVGVRAILAVTTEQAYTRDRAVLDMRLQQDYQPATTFPDESAAGPLPAVETSVLQRARSRGALRVGYFADNPPYAYVNGRGELVGFDVEMAHQLATDLGVRLELVPLPRDVLQGLLDSLRCDILMAGIAVTPDRAANLLLSASYLDETPPCWSRSPPGGVLEGTYPVDGAPIGVRHRRTGSSWASAAGTKVRFGVSTKSSPPVPSGRCVRGHCRARIIWTLLRPNTRSCRAPTVSPFRSRTRWPIVTWDSPIS
jgi:hypothetical protein